jgi:OmpA-OmpF porin, OOP family
LIFSLSATLADSDGWYVAADAGQSDFTGTADLNSADYAPILSNTDSGYRLSAGYQFNQYFGLEVGYADFGRVNGNGSVVGPPPPGLSSCGYLCPMSYDVNLNLKTHGWTLAFIGSYPFNEEWSISARVGEIDAHSELNIDDVPIPPYETGEQPYSESFTSTNWRGAYGLSLNWLFAERWAARLSWDRYVNLGNNNNIGSYDVNLASLGIVYRF